MLVLCTKASSQMSFFFVLHSTFYCVMPYMMRVQTESHNPLTPFKNVEFKTFECLEYLMLQSPYRKPFFPLNSCKVLKNVFAFIDELAFCIPVS